MESKNSVLIKIESIDKIIKDLKEISLLCLEPQLEEKIKDLQTFVTGILGPINKLSIEDLIFEKMVEVKHINPDLHLKLYMLYRNLVSERISEIDARISFENLLERYQSDVLVY